MSRVRRSAEMESRTTDSAIAARGYCLKLVAVTGHVDLTGADEAFYGVSYTDTKVPVSSADGSLNYTATADLPVAIQTDGTALCTVVAGNAAIAIGQVVQTAAGGLINLFTPAGATPTGAELDSIVGIALDTVADSAAGTCRVKLRSMVGTAR